MQFLLFHEIQDYAGRHPGRLEALTEAELREILMPARKKRAEALPARRQEQTFS